MPKEEKGKEKINKKPELEIKFSNLLSKFQIIPDSEKIFFIQNLGIMLKAGISLSRALRTLARQTKNSRFKKIIYDLYHRVEEGQTLTESLRKYENVFSELFINMVEAGEISGKLEDVLKHLYIQLKKEHQLKNKIRGALIYPSVIFVAMVGIGTAMVIFVVPRLVSIFEGVNMELPLMTRMLIKVSNNISAHGTVFLFSLIIFAFVIRHFLKTKVGKYYWHLFLLKIPIFSPIFKKINLARFARTMSSLLKTDIKIVKSFKITANTLGNVHYKKSLENAAEKIKKGEELHKSLSSYPNLYPEMIIQMIDVGEETGELDNILEELSLFYEEEVEEIMNTLPSIIEPIIILILGLAIGAMAVAIIMPMYSLTKAF